MIRESMWAEIVKHDPSAFVQSLAECTALRSSDTSKQTTAILTTSSVIVVPYLFDPLRKD